MSFSKPMPEAVATFCRLVETIRLVHSHFLRYGGEYSPFDAFYALPDPCPSCGKPSFYCCFSGPLGGGSSITEEYLHVCVGCRHNEFRDTWYGYDGSSWADCSCLICHFQYGDLLTRPGEVRVRDFRPSAYTPLSTSELRELASRNIDARALETIRQELERRSAKNEGET